MATPIHELHRYLLRREDDLRRSEELPAGLVEFVSFGRFITTVLTEFLDDHCMQMAAALSYSSLLALVPVTTLFFSIFTAFSAFQDLRRDIEGFLSEHLFANVELGKQILYHLDGFAGNAKQLGLFALVALIVTVIFLMITVENSLNSIWRVPPRRKLLTRVVTYAALVFLGPVLLALSFYMTNKTIRAIFLDGMHISPDLWKFVSGVTISMIMFFLAYVTVPDTRVQLRPALAGGMVAGALFEWAKWGFDQYLQVSHFYIDVYKTLGLVPIFLVWLYLVWLITLLGMEITYVSQNQQYLRDYTRGGRDEVEITDPALVATMVQISKYFYEGRPESSTDHQLAGDLGIPLFLVDEILRHLEKNGFIHRIAGRRDTFTPSQPIDHVTIQDLLDTTHSDEILVRLSEQDIRFRRLRDAFLRAGVQQEEIFYQMTLAEVVRRDGGSS